MRWFFVCFALIFATPSFADLNYRELYEAKLTLRERIFIQNDLIIGGYFDGVVDGVIGPATTKGIKSFQKKNGFRPNGLLDSIQLSLLDRQSKLISSTLGLTYFDDERAGFSYMVPEAFVSEIKLRENGTQFFGQDSAYIQSAFVIKDAKGTLRSLFEAKKKAVGKDLIKAEFRGSYFVIYEANVDATTYYTVHRRKNELRGTFVSVDSRIDDRVSSPAKFIIRSFMPFNEKPLTIAPPAPIREPADVKPDEKPFSGV